MRARALTVDNNILAGVMLPRTVRTVDIYEYIYRSRFTAEHESLNSALQCNLLCVVGSDRIAYILLHLTPGIWSIYTAPFYFAHF